MSSSMLRDIFGQAIEAMRHNLRRTSITVLGMAWGIATVVLLLAYGAGFGRAFETIFAQFGTNMIGIFPGTTSEQPRPALRSGSTSTMSNTSRKICRASPLPRP